MMKTIKFKNLVKIRVQQNAYNYLIRKQGSKGKANAYKDLSMAEYLLLTNKILYISEQA